LRILRVAPLVALVLLAACNKKPGEQGASGQTQVAAEVNDGEISVHQVQALLRLQPALGVRFGEQATERALDTLIEQELAAQAAVESGLDASPQVIQALALARREVLARAYQDQQADKASLPDTAAINRYYDEHPELFAERKRYELEETAIRVDADQVEPMIKVIEGFGSPEELQAWIGQQRLAKASRRSTQMAENLPLDVLPRLAKLKAGQSIAMRRPDGLLVMTVLRYEEMPALLAQANKAIYNVLLNQRRQEAVREGMTRLREQAKITRLTAPAAAASAASAPSAP
jgi:EpsD family peptidyl-prolyl cis-trans isomerase